MTKQTLMSHLSTVGLAAWLGDGSLLDHEFTIRRGDQVVARISKQWFAIRDTYGVEIAEGEDWLLLLACVLALDLAEDREHRDN